MIKVGIIGLDTSHSVEFVRCMQAPDCPESDRVAGMRAVTCLRFETPFQNVTGLDTRQKRLEEWGVKVTLSLEEALAGCDAYMLEINDPAFHLEYFKKVAGLGKPVFLDKPLAGTLADGREIVNLARTNNTRVWSASSLPFTPALIELIKGFQEIKLAHVYGPLGKAPAGDSLIWYGVHTYEMLLSIMGCGAATVRGYETPLETVALVEYECGRQGIIECVADNWFYGGRIHGKNQQGKDVVVPFQLNPSYCALLNEIKAFFGGAPAPVSLDKTFEGLALMVATRQSIIKSKSEPVATLQLR